MAGKKKAGQAPSDGPKKSLIASNKKARHDYHIDDT